MSAPKKSYNPSIVGFVPDDRFGLKDEDGNRIPGTAFKSYTLQAEGFANLQKFVTIGSTLVLRKSTKKNSKGSEQFFLEVLPPAEGKQQRAPKSAKPSIADDSI